MWTEGGLSQLEYFGGFVTIRCLLLWKKPLVSAPLPFFYHLPPPSYVIFLRLLWVSQAVPALCPGQACFPVSQCCRLSSWELLCIFRALLLHCFFQVFLGSSTASLISSSSPCCGHYSVCHIGLHSSYWCPCLSPLWSCKFKGASCIQYITDVYW